MSILSVASSKPQTHLIFFTNMEFKKRSVISSKSSYKLHRAQSRSSYHCCVPLCTASSKYNNVISFHRFPKNPKLQSQWITKIKRDQFVITPYVRVCSRHFESGQIITSPMGRRSLVPNAVPTLFQWNNYSKRQRIGVCCPRQVQSKAAETEEENLDAAYVDPLATDCELAQETLTVMKEHDYVASSLVVDRIKYENMVRELEELREKEQSLYLTQRFSLERFSSSPEDIRYYTRFQSYKHLMAFWNLIHEATTRMVRITSVQRSLSTSTVTESPVTRPTKLLPIDELFLFLNYLSTGCSQRELSHKFNIHRATVSRIIVTWANFLYTLLGSVSTWMSSAAVRVNRPQDFEGPYENTQVILNCTEIKCQTPSSLLLQSEVFSKYKCHCSFKALIGMSPHGALTFVSALFEGAISDEELFRHSGITSLLTSDMDIMVDKGFLVDELVPGNVHRPPFMSKQAQMPEVDVLCTQSVARLSVHVERLIRRVKENKLFDTIIPLSISGSINQIFTVACLLTNYQYGYLV